MTIGRKFISTARWIVRALILGLAVGTAMNLFSRSILFVIDLRTRHSYLIFFIPVAALSIYLLYKKLGPQMKNGTAYVIDQINNIRPLEHAADSEGDRTIPLAMAPLLWVSAMMSHLTGASTGKEGAGVQIGSSIASYLKQAEDAILPKKWEIHSANESGIWLLCGAGAAFGALFNAPIAGTLFGLHFASPDVNRSDGYLPCLVATSTAVLFNRQVLKGATLTPPAAEEIAITFSNMFSIIIIAVLAGLFCKLFLYMHHAWDSFMSKKIKNRKLIPVISGLVAVALSFLFFLIYGDFRLNGLSDSLISEPAAIYTPILKTVLTVTCMGAGLIGGEVIPVMVTGSTLACACAPALGLPITTLAMFGSMGMLAAATKLPLACCALGLELFGFSNPFLLFIACIIACSTSGKQGIYAKQGGLSPLHEVAN